MSCMRREKNGKLLAANPPLEQRVEEVAREIFQQEKRLFPTEVLQAPFRDQLRRRVSEELGDKLYRLAREEQAPEILRLIEIVQQQFRDLPVTPEEEQRFMEVFNTALQDPSVVTLEQGEHITKGEVTRIAQELVEETRRSQSPCCAVQ